MYTKSTMQVTFDEEPSLKVERKKTILDGLIDLLIWIGVAKTQKGALRIISFVAVLVFLVSAYTLMDYLNNSGPTVPGVDFEPPQDPKF